eukprot:CAMPEP_0168178170 /NCGR_PEP_ID=MMETSP0139_2-20121125/8940_1 /TAXON_ID=44445 /ORGANISM="Pseudo-nitzschia australis, Strain 10249 10 AB" /LENGTH=158 /DNA_ID=CAMNT_0008097461 /DNA_START=252 /DNA_END=727 /DNA_ORIENTATION=-
MTDTAAVSTDYVQQDGDPNAIIANEQQSQIQNLPEYLRHANGNRGPKHPEHCFYAGGSNRFDPDVRLREGTLQAAEHFPHPLRGLLRGGDLLDRVVLGHELALGGGGGGHGGLCHRVCDALDPVRIHRRPGHRLASLRARRPGDGDAIGGHDTGDLRG